MTANSVINSIIQGEFDPIELVRILELSAHELRIQTVSKMAKIEGKSPNGIRKSNRYKKVFIGGQEMAIKGIKNDNTIASL